MMSTTGPASSQPRPLAPTQQDLSHACYGLESHVGLDRRVWKCVPEHAREREASPELRPRLTLPFSAFQLKDQDFRGPDRSAKARDPYSKMSQSTEKHPEVPILGSGPARSGTNPNELNRFLSIKLTI